MRLTSRGALLGSALGLGAAVLLPMTAASANFEIRSPNVEQGVLELELFGTRTFDNNRDKNNEQTHRFEISYGVNSWWKTEIETIVKKESRGKLTYDATEWENIFQLTPQGKYWLDAGLLVAYERPIRHNDPDEVEFGLLLQKEIGPLVIVTNTIFNRKIGQNAGKGIGFEYAVQAKYPWRRELQFAVEAFGEPGRLTGFERISDQEHKIGPFVLGKFNIGEIPGSFKYNAGYLFGLTPGTPNGTVKWQVEYEIPF
jgi:hypothetical protein